ncbi:porin [Undibacterium arcticum]
MDSPGVLFNRDAWLGVESKSLGKLTFGRQNTLAREFSKIYGDPYGTAGVTLEEGGYSNNNNFKQLIFYSGSATGTRYDKGVVWKKKEFGNIVAGVGYQFGGVPGDFSQGSTKSLGLAYNGGAANISGFLQYGERCRFDQQKLFDWRQLPNRSGSPERRLHPLHRGPANRDRTA